MNYGRHAVCGAENPDYPGEYACTLPKGHQPTWLDDEQWDHAAPASGAWWNMPTKRSDLSGFTNSELLAELVGRGALVEERANVWYDPEDSSQVVWMNHAPPSAVLHGRLAQPRWQVL